MLEMDDRLEQWSNQFLPWAWNLGVVVFAILVGFIIKLIISAFLHYYKNQNDYSLFKSIITHLGSPLNYFVPLLMLNLLLPLLKLTKAELAPINKLVEILLIIAFSNLLINTIKIFEDYVYHQYDLTKADN